MPVINITMFAWEEDRLYFKILIPLWDVESPYFTTANQKNRKSASSKISK